MKKKMTIISSKEMVLALPQWQQQQRVWQQPPLEVPAAVSHATACAAAGFACSHLFGFICCGY
jgi:hypothetical protein